MGVYRRIPAESGRLSMIFCRAFHHFRVSCDDLDALFDHRQDDILLLLLQLLDAILKMIFPTPVPAKGRTPDRAERRSKHRSPLP